MDITIKIICIFIAFLFSFVTSLVAFIRGLSNRKVNKKFTQTEQENDLYDYMVGECIQIERFSKIIKNSMTKEELSEYKRKSVLSNISLYAKANSYDWYNSEVWANELDDYITQANASSGKEKTVKVNVG